MMEEENVLMTDPDAQQDITPTQTAPDEVITSTTNIYQQAAATKVSQPIGEPNYTQDIINSNDYNYLGAVDQSKDPVVETTSFAKGNVSPINAIWESEYGMDDRYKSSSEEDYSWNKIARAFADTKYQQEEAQVKAEYAKSKQQILEAGSAAMDTFFGAVYSAAQSADKMGWTGGSELRNDLKTAFLKAQTASNMFSQAEMQRYGVESQLSVARLHAEAERMTKALDLYQDAVDSALRMGDQTGYYISAEAGEMMKQSHVAREMLKDKNLSQVEKNRAEKVIAASNKYFDQQGFQKDKHGNYIGVETLSMLQHKEQERANRAQEALQKQANDIQSAANAIARDALVLQQREIAINEALLADANYTKAADEAVVSKNKTPLIINQGKGWFDAVPFSTGPNGETLYRGVQGTDQSKVYVEDTKNRVLVERKKEE